MIALISTEAQRLLPGIVPWALFFHGCYWTCRWKLAKYFDTYNELERDKRGYWCATMVSSFHAILISALSARCFMEDATLRSGEDFLYSTPLSMLTTKVFFGYIVSDLLLSVWYRARWPGWVANLVHHVSILATWSVFLSTGSGQFFALVAHLCELTTPFVNQRWFLYEAGLKTGKPYFYNGLAMVFLWFITRIIVYTWAGFQFYKTLPQVRSLGDAAAGTILSCYFLGLFLQYMWFYKMVKGAIKSIKANAAGETDKTK